MNASTLKQKLKRNKIARIGAKVLLPNPYPKYYEKLDVDRNIILYESFYGKGMTCGPKAIFDQLTKSIVVTSTKHVWVYDDEKQWAANFKKYKKCDYVKFVKFKSDEYYKMLASAGVLINNSTFPPCFIRKPEQDYICLLYTSPSPRD